MRNIVIFIVLQVSLTACAAKQSEVGLEDANALSVPFSGTTSRGEPVSGQSWFVRGASEGEFCVRVGSDTTCTGRYGTNAGANRLSTPFSCSDGRSGVMMVQRVFVSEYNLMKPLTGNAKLTDGTTAEIEFGKNVPFNGKMCR